MIQVQKNDDLLSRMLTNQWFNIQNRLTRMLTNQLSQLKIWLEKPSALIKKLINCIRANPATLIHQYNIKIQIHWATKRLHQMFKKKSILVKLIKFACRAACRPQLKVAWNKTSLMLLKALKLRRKKLLMKPKLNKIIVMRVA